MHEALILSKDGCEHELVEIFLKYLLCLALAQDAHIHCPEQLTDCILTHQR